MMDSMKKDEDEPSEEKSAAFRTALAETERIVARWPAWKQEILKKRE